MFQPNDPRGGKWNLHSFPGISRMIPMFRRVFPGRAEFLFLPIFFWKINLAPSRVDGPPK